MMRVRLRDAAATEGFGACLAEACGEEAGLVIYLRGDLGAGKTTLSRGFLRASGHRGAVKSPTYTLVEPYEMAGRRVYHFDLYRLGDPEELEYLGSRDYFEDKALCLIEWPERGAGALPKADLDIRLVQGPAGGRVGELDAGTDAGRHVEARLGEILGRRLPDSTVS